MLGGDLSFGAGAYAGGPVEDVLPVRLAAGKDRRLQEFRAQLTPAGSRHPVMDLGDPGIFGRLPPLGSYQKVLGLAPDALALLSHPFERSSDGPAPLLAVREVGRGRSAAVLTDGSWRWNFVYAGQGGDPRPYTRLYNNLIRWLIRDPIMDAVQLESAKKRYGPGETVQLAAKVFDLHPDAQVWLSLLEAGGQEAVERRSLVPDDRGQALASFEGLAPGAYLARLELGPGAKVEEAFVVEGAAKELAQPQARPDIMEAIAQATGGLARSLAEADLDELRLSVPERYRLESSRTRPILHEAWVLALLMACWVLEWFLRRRWGFA